MFRRAAKKKMACISAQRSKTKCKRTHSVGSGFPALFSDKDFFKPDLTLESQSIKEMNKEKPDVSTKLIHFRN